MLKKFLNAAVAASMMCVFAVSEVEALPMVNAGSPEVAEANPLVQEARVYCYNRYTGRFLHWGSCGGRRIVRRRPGRVYCYNRYTGRFLHWGHC